MSDDESLKCKLNKKRIHLLKDPKLLPCHNSCCLRCISEAVRKTNYFRCNFENCKEKHIIQDARSLQDDSKSKKTIKANLQTISKEFLERSNRVESELTDKCNAYQELVETRVEDAIIDIELRIESIKIDLEKFLEEIETFLDKIRSDHKYKINRFNYKIKQIHKDDCINTSPDYYLMVRGINEVVKGLRKEADCIRFRDSIIQIQSKIKQRPNSSRPASARPNSARPASVRPLNPSRATVKDIYETQKLGYKLRRTIRFLMIHNFDLDGLRIFNNLPTTKVLGTIIDPFVFNLESIQERDENKLEVSHAKTLKHSCNIDDKYLIVSDPKTNSIFTLNQNLEFVKLVYKIDTFRLEYPLGVCVDDCNNIYICDHANHRVLVVDSELRNVIRVLGKTKQGGNEFDGPFDVCYYANHIYVLDRGHKQVKKFTIHGVLLKVYDLYKVDDETTVTTERDPNRNEEIIQKLTMPSSVKVMSDTIAVTNISKVYIYNFEGTLMQILEANNIKCTYFMNSHLFTYDNQGYLACYFKSKCEFKEIYKYRFEQFKNIQISSIIYFNNSLILTGDIENLLVVI